ncbi:MAG: hypothetical protein MR592_09135, partial [Prevotella sp.]|nr:hypothetical protein [Prevotella sp.]
LFAIIFCKKNIYLYFCTPKEKVHIASRRSQAIAYMNLEKDNMNLIKRYCAFKRFLSTCLTNKNVGL